MLAALTKDQPNHVTVDWVRGVRAYLAVTAVANLAWEILQLPLYTIWSTGTLREQAFAIAHCTLGDVLIAVSALTLALVLAGNRQWPAHAFWPVAAATMLFGVGYTIFSEWLNVVVRRSWAYSEWMPVIRLGGMDIGVSPLVQWMVVPAAALWSARRAASSISSESSASTKPG